MFSATLEEQGNRVVRPEHRSRRRATGDIPLTQELQVGEGGRPAQTAFRGPRGEQQV